MNDETVKALRVCADCTDLQYGTGRERCTISLMRDAADALEAAEKRIDGLQKLVDINTERCEALRKQLRESHENYEKHLQRNV